MITFSNLMTSMLAVEMRVNAVCDNYALDSSSVLLFVLFFLDQKMKMI